MAYDSRTDRKTATWERRAERARRYNAGKVKRQTTSASQRRAYREYGEFDD